MGKTVTHPTHTHVNKAFVDMVSKCHHEFKCVILLHAAYIKKTVPSRNPASTHRPDWWERGADPSSWVVPQSSALGTGPSLCGWVSAVRDVIGQSMSSLGKGGMPLIYCWQLRCIVFYQQTDMFQTDIHCIFARIYTGIHSKTPQCVNSCPKGGQRRPKYLVNCSRWVDIKGKTIVIYPGYGQTKLSGRPYVGLRRLLSFSSAQEAWSTGGVELTLYTIGCLLSLPCPHCVQPANSAPGGEASLVIGSHKNISEAERNVLLFSRPCCKANSNLWQKGLGGGTQSNCEHEQIQSERTQVTH